MCRGIIHWSCLLGLLLHCPVMGVPQDSGAVVSPLNRARDLDLTGHIVYAINFGNNGNPKIGDFVFLQDQDYPHVKLTLSAEGIGSTWEGVSPNTGNGQLDNLLGGVIWRYNEAGESTSIALGGLTVGVRYQLQLIFYETEHSRSSRIIVEGDTALDYFDPYSAQGYVTGKGGSVVTYTFTANDDTLNVSIPPINSGLATGISGLILTGLLPDFNFNWKVDMDDLVWLIEHWGQDEPSLDLAPIPAGDGTIDRQDLEVFMNAWGQELTNPQLLAHWKFDEACGDLAHDSMGDNDADLLGGPIWKPTAGQSHGALQLDGIDDHVTTDFVLNPAAGSFSVFAWVKGGAPGQVIVSQRDDGTDPLGASWLACDAVTGCLMTGIIRSTGRVPSELLVSEAVINDGAWHQVGFTYDGKCRSLYVDGSEVAHDVTAQGTLDGTQEGLNIGTSKNLEPGSFWLGLIDDVRLYNRVIIP